MPIRILELHHHAVRIPPNREDADRVREFYGTVLGLDRDPGRPEIQGVPGYWINAGTHAQVHLVGGEGRLMDPAFDIDPSAPHVAFAVEDIAEARAELQRLGIDHRILQGVVGPGSEQVFLKDPAGNLIELHQTGCCRCTAASRAGEQPGYTRVWSAVMFADMRGFTGISEQLNPTDVVPLLNEYFSMLTEITVRHGGTVFNMAGDGLMVGFGVPREQLDAPERAVDSAREMLSRFAGLAAGWKRRHGFDAGIGIGINAGEVIAGNVGSRAYMSYTLIGDTVNVASRLSQRARAGEALFSGVVKRSLEQHGRDLPAIELPALQLRGRASPVEIYCIPAAERLDFRPGAAS
jgi:class 3 adenylate cyclase/catechol 2,3-dioxygenase-like lactoylglutathione lyase family enzyme